MRLEIDIKMNNNLNSVNDTKINLIKKVLFLFLFF